MTIHKQLLAAQKEIKHAIKDATNPHFKNQYATLTSVIDAVKDVANKHGLFITQLYGKDVLGHFIETKVIGESGELSSKLYLEVDKPTMQGLGSAQTYGRRYSLAALFGIAQEDDDANEASTGTDWKQFNNKQGASNVKRTEL